MQKNKIISQYIKPQIMILSAYIVLATMSAGGFVYISENRAAENKIGHKIHTKNIVGFCSIITVLLILGAAIKLKHDGYALLSRMMRRYIDNLIQDDNDFQNFKYLLDNPYALRSITDFISAHLSVSEQKQIVDIMHSTEQYVNPLKMKDAYNQIQTIVKKHIQMHPEFIPSVYAEMTCLQYECMMRKPQERIN